MDKAVDFFSTALSIAYIGEEFIILSKDKK